MIAIAEIQRVLDYYYWRTALLIAGNKLEMQYRSSFLGMLWTLLQPLSLVIVYSIIMPLIFRFPMENYAFYIITSIPLWGFISNTIITSCSSIIAEAETMKRCMISSTVFPLAEVFKQAYTFLLSFGVMYGFALVFLVPFTPSMLLYPIYFLGVMVIIMSWSIMFAFVAPYVRDIGEFLMVIMNISFWLTPVVYAPEVIDEKYRIYFEFNPFYILMRPIQELQYFGHIPTLHSTLSLLALMVVSAVVSYVVYRVCRRNYVYYL